MLELAAAEQDEELVEEISGDLDQADRNLSKLEFQRMFAGAMDENNSFIDIQSGSGGTEAQDWANMMLRMYLRWAESEAKEVCRRLPESNGDFRTRRCTPVSVRR